MNKDQLEDVFRKGGVKPVERKRSGDFDIFIGDGFSLMPHMAYRRFGVDEDEFPSGMYVTWWWVGKDEKLDIGSPVFFDVLSHPYAKPDRQKDRIKVAVADAEKFIARRKKNGTN